MAKTKAPKVQAPRDRTVSVMLTEDEWAAVTRLAAEETIRTGERVTSSSLIRSWIRERIPAASR
jgi:hypothetical protein